MAVDVPSQVAKDWTDDERVRAFSCLLRHAGDTKKAIAELNADGLPVTAAALEQWRDRTHSSLYVTLADEQGRAVEEMAAARLRENALRSTHLESEIMDKIADKVRTDDASLTDLAKAFDAITKSRSSGIDRVLSLTGRPVDGKGSTDPKDIERALIRMGVLKQASETSVPVIDIPEADVVPEGEPS